MKVVENKIKTYILICMFIGLCGGFASGLLGLGGAFLFIPPMVSILGIERHKAHATTLGIMFFTSAMAVAYLFGDSRVSLGLLIYPVLGSIAGVLLGTKLMLGINSRLLTILFGGFLILASITTALLNSSHNHNNQIQFTALVIITLALIGFVAGFTSGLLGVGSGGVVIPLVIIVLGVNQLAAQGISLAVIAPVSLIGGGFHWVNGTLNKKAMIWISVGAVTGSLVGVKTATSIPSSILHTVFILVLFGVGIGQIFSATKTAQKAVNENNVSS